MILLRRLACLLLPSVLVCCLAAPHSESQTTNDDSRFAFADTTLLRDTLGLTFERLFPLADSLRMEPSALKGLSVTYGWTLLRLVKMADSLDVPIDSVGPIMERERFNPLANVGTRSNMTYESQFTPRASGNAWMNTLNQTLNRGKIFATNQVSTEHEDRGRNGANGRSLDRSARSSVNWRFSQRFSLGAEMALSRLDIVTPSGVGGQSERISDYGISMHVKPRPWHGLTPTLSTTGTVNQLDQIAQQKSGPKGTMNGSLRYNPGTWFSQDFNLALTSSRVSATPLNVPASIGASEFPAARGRDNSSKLRATTSLFRGRFVEFSANYQSDNTRTQIPNALVDTTTRIVTGPVGPETTTVYTPITSKGLTRIARENLDGTMRIVPSQNSSVDVRWNSSSSSNRVTNLPTSTNSSDREGLTASGRLDLGAWRFESSFRTGSGTTRYPLRDFPRGGYREQSENRALDGRAQWTVSSQFRLSLEATISLDRARYARIDSALTVPVDNDRASQSYKLTASHDFATGRNTTVSMKVARSQNVNIPSSSTASNTDGRNYVGTWIWNWLIFTGMTATQTNIITADYTTYPFAPSTNRLNLRYNTTTTVNTVLNPRLTVDLTHSASYEPRGNYRPIVPGDPTEYLTLADQSENLSLEATVRYTPIPAISVNVTPSYNKNDRSATRNDRLQPQRSSRSMRLRGGASLNLSVGGRGQLTGSISRELNTSRTIEYSSSGTQIQPRTESSNLNGSLRFRWNL